MAFRLGMIRAGSFLKRTVVPPWNFILRHKSENTLKYLIVKSIGQKSNIGLIRLNDRKTMNTLTSPLVAELNQTLKNFEQDKGISSIILTGSERTFSVGANVKEMMQFDFPNVVTMNFPSNLLEVSRCCKPVIAAVNGYAVGGGFELAMMCDIVYAGENAVFAQPEIYLGTIPGAGGTQRLTRAAGKSKTMEIVLSGMKMSATEAYEAGLVSKVFPTNRIVDEALRLAERIASFPLMLVQMAKQAVISGHEMSLSNGLHFENSLFLQTLALEKSRSRLQ